MRPIITCKQTGFTLVELLVVMLILVALASVTLDFTKDFAFQGRYEVTKDRYEKIRRAIIGRPDVLINGQPDISGFVADMGRLPDNIRELLQSGYCVTSGGSAPTNLIAMYRPSTCTGDWKWSTSKCTDNTKTTEITCTGGHRWLGRKINLGLNYGWNGPYASVTKDPNTNNALVDGWGTESDELNYGWNFSNLTSPDTGLRLNSFGKDGVSGSGASTYDIDYPSTNASEINANLWTVNITGIQVNSLASGVSSSTACSGIPFNSNHITCEMTGGHWEGSCAPTVAYTTRFQCEVANGETWTPTSSCTTPTIPVTKYGCENLGGSWTSDTTNVCLKVYYKSINTASGELIVATPLVSTGKTIREDGLMHLINFDGFFIDNNNDGIKNGSDADLSIVPTGQVRISLHNYNTGSSECTATKYNSGTNVLTTIFNSSLLPVINW